MGSHIVSEIHLTVGIRPDQVHNVQGEGQVMSELGQIRHTHIGRGGGGGVR